MASALTIACSRLIICFLRRVLPNSSTSLRATQMGALVTTPRARYH